MKKHLTIILIIGCVILLAIIGWFWLLPGSSAPMADKVKDLLPFGTGEGVNIPVDSDQQIVDSGEGREGGQEVPKLFQISKDPVAGFVAFNPSTSSGRVPSVGSTTIRYADRATGHIYDVDPNTLLKTKVTNKTLPKIYRAYFSPDGDTVIYQSLSGGGDLIDTLSINLTAPKSTSTDAVYSISATAIPGNITGIVVASNNALYSVDKSRLAIISSNLEGGNLKEVYSSRFTDWRLEPYGQNLLIYTKAASNTPGFAYTLTSSGRLTKILGPLDGLVVKPNSDGGYAYSYNMSGSLNLMAKESSTAQEVSLTPTIAEKCVWSQERSWVIFCAVPESKFSANEPDSWYQGTTRFSDKIWRFDIRVSISEALVDPKKTFNTDIDVYQPTISPNEDYLIFINKNDLSLWALKLD